MAAQNNPHISGQDARRAARNAGAIMLASIISKGALFGWQIFLARSLGDADYGVYGSVGAFIAIGMSIVSFGMGPIIIREVARAPEKAGRYLSITLILQSGLALVAYCGLALVASLGGYPEVVQGFLLLAGVNLLIDILGTMVNDMLIAQERMWASSWVSILHVLLLISAAALALIAGYGLQGVYIATILTGVARSGILWALLLRGGVRPVFPVDWGLSRVLLLSSAPLALSSFITLAGQHIDKLITTRLLGTVSTGYLTAAFTVIFGVVELLNTTVLTATYPMMSRYYAEGVGEAFGFMVEKLAFFTLFITLPIGLVISIFSVEIIQPLLGEDWLAAAAVLRVLIWYAVVMMFNNIFAQAMLVQNRQRRLMLIRAGGLALNITMNFILIQQVGVLGVAFASLAAELLMMLVLMANFRAVGLLWRRLIPRLGRLLLLAALSAGLMLWLGSVTHFLLAIVLGLALYAAGILYGRILGADDWDLLYRLIAVAPGGALVRRYWRRDVPLNW
jgi:O-antigen/teichoic acid export membrane protein